MRSYFWMMFSGDPPSGGAEGISGRSAKPAVKISGHRTENGQTSEERKHRRSNLACQGNLSGQHLRCEGTERTAVFAAGSVCSCFLEVAWKA